MDLESPQQSSDNGSRMGAVTPTLWLDTSPIPGTPKSLPVTPRTPQQLKQTHHSSLEDKLLELFGPSPTTPAQLTEKATSKPESPHLVIQIPLCQLRPPQLLPEKRFRLCLKGPQGHFKWLTIKHDSTGVTPLPTAQKLKF